MGGLIHTIYSGTYIYESTFDAYINVMNYMEEYTVLVGGMVAKSYGGSINNSIINSIIAINTGAVDSNAVGGVVGELHTYASLTNSISNITKDSDSKFDMNDKVTTDVDGDSVVSSVYYLGSGASNYATAINVKSLTDANVSIFLPKFDFGLIWELNIVTDDEKYTKNCLFVIGHDSFLTKKFLIIIFFILRIVDIWSTS